MKKKDIERKKLRKWVKDIQYAFCLDNWSLSFRFVEADRSAVGAVAEMTTQHEYLSMNLIIYRDYFETPECDQFENLIHEFSHVLTAETVSIAQDLASGKLIHLDLIGRANERSTSLTARMALSMMKNTKLQKIWNKCGNTYTST